MALCSNLAFRSPVSVNSEKLLQVWDKARPRLAQNPRAPAGRLRRAQTFPRALGIEVAFAREGRSGSRVIRIFANTGSSVRREGPSLHHTTVRWRP